MKVMTIANSRRVKGGITSVVNSLIEGVQQDYPDIRMDRHASYMDYSGALSKVCYSLFAMAKLLFTLPFYRMYHLHSAANGSFYRKAIYTYMCKLAGKKVIFHIHGSSFEDFHNSSARNAAIIRKTLNRSDEIIVLSEQMKSLVLTYCENERITILPNPIQIPDRLENPPSSEDGRVQLLFLGEIGPRKGIYDLVDAIGELPAEVRSKLVLHICGNNEIEKVKQVIRQKGLTEACIVHGWIDGAKKEQMLRQADLYVLPSYHEGLPVSILEAMAYQLPIISTPVGGIPEIVRHQENGLLVRPGDVKGLAAAIGTLTEHPELRAGMGRKSREAAAPHDLKQVTRTLVELYRRVGS